MSSAVLSDLYVRKLPADRGSSWFENAHQELQTLSLLPSDWDGENAAKPQKSIIRAVHGFINYIMTDAELHKVTEPTIAPTRNGGVLLEWNQQKFRLDVEFASPYEARYAGLDRDTKIQCRGAILVNQDFSIEFSQCLGHFVE